MTHVPSFAPEADFIKRLIANRPAQRVMGMRTRATHYAAADRGFERLAMGRRPQTLAKALAIPGSRYGHDQCLDVFGHRVAGDMTISPLAVRTLELLGIDARALAVGAFMHGLSPFRIDIDGVRVITVAHVDNDRERPLRLAIEVALPKACRWIPNIGLLDMPGPLPETLLSSMAGRPLQAMISHPLLDALGLDIEVAFDDHGTTTVHVPSRPQRRVADYQPLRRAP